MAGPAFDQWISDLGLQDVDAPGIGKRDLLMASIEKLRTFDEETLRDVFSLLGRLDGRDQSDHARNSAASAASQPSEAADDLKEVNGKSRV